MTRPRSRAPGHPDPVYRRSRLPLLVSLALIVGACIGSGTPAVPAAERVPITASPVPSTLAPTAIPSPTAAPAATPTETPGPTATAAPTETATAEPTPTGSPATGEGSVDGCAGSDDNRAFFANAAADLDWPVYCPALPARWFVSGGSYSLAGRGKLEITYRGPNGARLELREGEFCDDDDGCLPEGDEAGTAAFGDQTAAFMELDEGRVAAVVDPGGRISWLAIGEGLTDDAFRSLTSRLIRLD